MHLSYRGLPMPLYDRSAAVAYALKYAAHANWFDYGAPYSNDCTNFVSQVMLAGGWTMVGDADDRKENSAWWYGRSWWAGGSYTWAAAHNFSKFIDKSSRGTICARDALEIGDVVQIADKDSHVHHSMIVTVLSKNGPLMSYHSHNTVNRDLKEIEDLYQGHSFLYWKIAKSFA
jgi:hypothetical protein